MVLSSLSVAGKESKKGMKVTVTSTLEQDAAIKDSEKSREV